MIFKIPPLISDGTEPQQSKSESPTSFALLLEDIDSHERATLQVELVDVNDNAPRFLGGPFPLELVIPVVSFLGNFYENSSNLT